MQERSSTIAPRPTILQERAMKIVIAVENFNPDRGYTEYYLAREFTQLNKEVFVFTFGKNKKVKELVIDWFKVILLPYTIRIGPYHFPTSATIFYLIKFLRKNNIDVFHGQPITSPLSLIFVLLRGIFGYKCVGSIITGDYNVKSFLGKLHFAVIRNSINLIKDKVDCFFAINDNIAKFIRIIFNIPMKKIQIIPLGADSDLFKYNPIARVTIRQMLDISLGDVVICYSGKIRPAKYLHHLIRCLSDLIDQYGRLKIRLLIIGDGDRQYIDNLKKMSIKLGINDYIILHPSVHRNLLHQFYSASDIAVWPGAPSISIIEAASIGIPVISGSPFFYKQIEEDGIGFVFRRGNTNRLKKYLKLLIFNEELRRKMGETARKMVLKKYSWRKIAQQYLNVYAQLINKKS